MRSEATKRRRHVPVRNATHIYKSQRSDGSWSFEVRHPANAEGKRMFETVGTRLDQAKARAREVHGGNGPVALSVNTTFAEVVVDWRASRDMRKRSVETFDALLRLYIEKRWNRVKVREITPSMISAWLNGLKRADGKDGPLADATKRLILSTLSLVLRHAVDMGVLTAVPRLPRKKRPKSGQARRRIVTPDEELRLLAHSAAFPWLRPIITVTLHQALRLGEVAALRWEDVDFGRGKLRVRQAMDRDGTIGPTKGGNDEVIPLTPLARAALLELRIDSDGTGFVFRNREGRPRQTRYIQFCFNKAREEAVLQETEDGKVVFHSLRHTGISRLANHPAIPIIKVQEFARHASLVTTLGYTHPIEDEAMNDAIAEALAGTVAA